MKTIINLIGILISICILTSCKKVWLEEKPDQSLVVPATLKDFQSLLDNTNIFNQLDSYLGELATDDYYLASQVIFDARVAWEKAVYTWAPGNIFAGESVIADWKRYYEKVFYANNVLEGIESIAINNSNQNEWKKIKGSALFYRAFSFYQLSQLFCKTYSNLNAAEPGLVLRTSSNINIESKRSTVQETYNQILSDLKIAITLLPATVPHKTQPCLNAAYGLLARTFLIMGNYESSLYYSNKSIAENNSLLDYNSLYTPGQPTTNPFTVVFNNNVEIIFFTTHVTTGMLPNRSGVVDSNLYKLYNTVNDARADVFFELVSGVRSFTGSYTGAGLYTFDGIATDEIYLIRAESYSRKNMIAESMQDLNTLRAKRWKNSAGPFIPETAIDAGQALLKILTERRKELCFRGLRWTDLRRLNLEPQFARTLTRRISNSDYTLPPNDNRYVFPIPDDEMRYSNIEQNIR